MKKELTHFEKAKILRSFGFKPKLQEKKKVTPQLKAAVTRQFKAHASFLSPKKGTSPAKFFPANKSERRLAGKVLSRRSITPGGYWLQVPRGVKPQDYNVRVHEGGLVEKVRGRQNDRIIPLSRRDVSRDAVSAFRKAIAREAARQKKAGKGKTPKQVQLIVNGFQGKRVQSLKSMLFYLEHNPRFLDESGELEPGEFKDTFQLKLIYGSKSSKKSSGKKRARRAGRSR